MAERKGHAPHCVNCDSLDCVCYREGQTDLMMALRVMHGMGLSIVEFVTSNDGDVQ